MQQTTRQLRTTTRRPEEELAEPDSDADIKLNNVKYQEPRPSRLLNPFDGSSQASFTNWYMDLEEYFELYETPEEDQVRIATLFLTDGARRWWHGMRSSIKNGIMAPIVTWEKLKPILLARFSPCDTMQVTMNKLVALRQTSTVADYTNQFLELTGNIMDMSDREQMDRYMRGLKPHLFKELLRQRPASFLDAMNRASNEEFLSQQSYELRRGGMQSSINNGNHRPWQGQTMKSTHEARIFSDKEKQTLRQSGSCFHCRQPGHMAPQCPSKKREDVPYLKA
jgi:Retrotransposon gag protein/Zinc knuckle